MRIRLARNSAPAVQSTNLSSARIPSDPSDSNRSGIFRSGSDPSLKFRRFRRYANAEEEMRRCWSFFFFYEFSQRSFPTENAKSYSTARRVKRTVARFCESSSRIINGSPALMKSQANYLEKIPPSYAEQSNDFS